MTRLASELVHELRLAWLLKCAQCLVLSACWERMSGQVCRFTLPEVSLWDVGHPMACGRARRWS